MDLGVWDLHWLICWDLHTRCWQEHRRHRTGSTIWLHFHLLTWFAQQCRQQHKAEWGQAVNWISVRVTKTKNKNNCYLLYKSSCSKLPWSAAHYIHIRLSWCFRNTLLEYRAAGWHFHPLLCPWSIRLFNIFIKSFHKLKVIGLTFDVKATIEIVGSCIIENCIAKVYIRIVFN